MLLPLRDDMPSLPNNKSLNLRRLYKLGQRFQDDMKYRDDYTAFMNEIIAKGYAEEVPKEEASYLRLVNKNNQVHCSFARLQLS